MPKYGVSVKRLNYNSPKQVHEAAAIYGQAFSGPPWHENWPIEESLKEVRSWKKLIANGKGKVFVATTRGGRIIGLAVGHLHQKDEHSKILNAKLTGKEKHYYLREIATHPEFQRRGIASALTKARLKHARKLKCSTVFGRTRTDNTPRIEQFEKEGFENFHREEQVTGGVASQRVYYQKRL